MALSQEDRDLIDPQGATIRTVVSEAVEIQEELTNLNPNTEMDCKEWGEHVKNGDWRLGLLVARNVADDHGEKPWEDEGISRRTWYRRQEDGTDVNGITIVPKISCRAFARQAGDVSHTQVTKYLKAWNLAAADGYVPASSTLSPGDEVDFNGTDEDGKLILNQKLWDFYFKPPADNDKNPLVSLHSKVEGTHSIDLEVINKENYNSQSELTVDDGYKAACSMERVAKQLQEKYLALAKVLNITIKEGDEN